MNSLVFRATTQVVTPLLLALSVFMLLRGHNEPGGGFIGGLLAAAAFALYALAFDSGQARRLLYFTPGLLAAGGLLIAALSGCVAWLTGQPFMHGLWVPSEFPAELKLGTVLLFDIGVYFVVIGSVLLVLLTLGEDEAC
jgi:multicomponent Na+:H+ antiporter subunit B